MIRTLMHRSRECGSGFPVRPQRFSRLLFPESDDAKLRDKIPKRRESVSTTERDKSLIINIT